MAHTLAPSQPSLVAFSTKAKNRNIPLQCLGLQRRWSDNQGHEDQALVDVKSNTQSILGRRALVGGLSAAVLSLSVGNQTANAARRPPPPPPQEKKDPNVSGVQAKVLASKKRKEAMKEAVAKLREKGKAIDKTSE